MSSCSRVVDKVCNCASVQTFLNKFVHLYSNLCEHLKWKMICSMKIEIFIKNVNFITS